VEQVLDTSLDEDRAQNKGRDVDLSDFALGVAWRSPDAEIIQGIAEVRSPYTENLPETRSRRIWSSRFTEISGNGT
jgi:hypothetical protein